MRLLLWALLGMMSILGCGSSRGEEAAGDCGAGACGGDLRGTWNIVRGCHKDTVLPSPACDGKFFTTLSNVEESGTVTFNADGTFRTAVTIAYDETSTTPESCIEDAGSNCAGVTSEPGACSLSGDNCVCKGSRRVSTYTQLGTYTVSGSQVTLTLTLTIGKGTKTWDFCVQGSALHLHITRGFGVTLLDAGTTDIETD